MKNNFYIKIPNEYLYSLPEEVFKLLCCVIDVSDKSFSPSTCWMNKKEIADKCGWSERKAYRIIQKFETLDFVYKIRHTDESKSMYVFCFKNTDDERLRFDKLKTNIISFGNNFRILNVASYQKFIKSYRDETGNNFELCDLSFDDVKKLNAIVIRNNYRTDEISRIVKNNPNFNKSKKTFSFSEFIDLL